MKACLGQNLKISLPKAYQTKEKSKTLVVKGVPNLATTNSRKSKYVKYAKAERMKSKRDGRSLQIFQIELKDPAEAKAIISNNLTCLKQGSFLRWKSVELQFRSGSVTTAKISDTRPKLVRLKSDVSSVEVTHTEGAQMEKKQPKCANCKGPHVANYKGCPAYEKQVFRQHVVVNQKVMPPF